MSLLKNWRTLVAHNPDFALDEGGASKYPAIAATIATYESALSDWKEVCEKRAARDKTKYYTVRGGYQTEFYPKSASRSPSPRVPFSYRRDSQWHLQIHVPAAAGARCHQESQGLVRAPGARQGAGCARQEQPVPRRQRRQQP